MLRIPFGKFRTFAIASTLSLTAAPAVAGLFCHWCVDPMRPYCSPACEPNWGVHVTTWRQFPMTQTQNGNYCPGCQSGDAMTMQSLADGSGVPPGIVIPQSSPTSDPAPFNAPGPPSMQAIGANGAIILPSPQEQQNHGNEPVMPDRPDAGHYGTAPALTPTPMEDSSMPPAPGPLPNNLIPQPLDGQSGGASGPLPLPEFPPQTAAPAATQNHYTTFSGRRVPIFNGTFRQTAPHTPGYQQPASITATPLVQSSPTAPTRRVPVTGVSFSQQLTELNESPDQPKAGFRKFMKLPKLPFLRSK